MSGSVLLPAIIRGAEDDEAAGSTSESSSSDEGGNGAGNESGSSEDSQDGSQEHDDADDPKVKGLKSALEKTRQEAKAKDAELKELRKLKKAQDDAELLTKSEIEQATIREERATEKAKKLADGFLKTTINQAIRNAASELHFYDIDDALAGVDRAELVFSQDDDDPSNVTIDTKTVEKAVKALATKKPHLIKSGTDDGEASGSQFGGTRQKKATSTEEFKTRYPGL